MEQRTQKSALHSPPSAKERIGKIVDGRWILQEILGIGGMGTVYAGLHVNNGRRAAIKVLHSAYKDDVDVCQRFYDEAYAANQVSHPGAVPALDDGSLSDGTPFLVMELLDGESLEQRRLKAGGRLSERAAFELADAVLSVLSAAHQVGVVHRDVKPENVFFTSKGDVKLLDFGIAKIPRRSHQTDANASLGTPAFMAPEQARGRWQEVDERSDLWALGATLFSVLTGRLVHEAETTNELLLAAMTTSAPQVTKVAPSLSPGVASVLNRALSFDKQDRYASALEMQVAVRNVLMDQRLKETTAPMTAPALTPSSSHSCATLRAVVEGDSHIVTRASRRANKGALAVALLLSAASGLFALSRADSLPSGPIASALFRGEGGWTDLLRGPTLLTSTSTDVAALKMLSASSFTIEGPKFYHFGDTLPRTVKADDEPRVEAEPVWLLTDQQALAQRERARCIEAAQALKLVVRESSPSEDATRSLGSQAWGAPDENVDEHRLRDDQRDPVESESKRDRQDVEALGAGEDLDESVSRDSVMLSASI